MAQQKQRQGGFRFSLPSWMSEKAAPRPAPSQSLVVEGGSTPKQSPQSSPSQQTPPRAQPSKDIESHRPSPSRGSTQPPIVEPQSTPKQSPRVSPSQYLNQQQTPPRAHPSKDVESKRPSPSRASTQPRATNIQPPSPSLSGTQFHVTSKTPSPSQTRAPTQPPSPSPATKKPRPSVTQLPSPPRVDTQARVDPQPNSPSRTIHEAKRTLESTMKSRSSPNTTPTVPTANRDEMNVVGSKSEVDEKGDKKKQTLVGKLEEMIKVKGKVQEHNHITSDSNERSKSEAHGKGNEKNKTLVGKLEETIKGKGKVQERNHIMSHSNERSKSEVDEKGDEKNHKFVGKLEEMEKGKGKAQGTSHSNDIRVSPSTGSNGLNISHNLASNDGKTHVEEEYVNIKAALNPASSTKKFPKSVIPDLADKDRESISHHKHTKLNESRPLHKGIQDDISKFVHKITTDHQKVPLDGTPVSVITLQGENRGASMVLGSESGKREKKINIHRGYKVNPHENIDSTTEGEKSPTEASSINPERQEDEESEAYINSNIQSVNNSIMFNSSIAERNPGVHFATTSLMTSKFVHDTKSIEPIEANKTIFRVAQSQNLTPKPAIRRRCLKGLLMESSDSDPENPNKPRRHGCRAACGEKSTENKIDVL